MGRSRLKQCVRGVMIGVRGVMIGAAFGLGIRWFLFIWVGINAPQWDWYVLVLGLLIFTLIGICTVLYVSTLYIWQWCNTAKED